MDTSFPNNQNSIFGDSVLGSKWVNPDFLFNEGVKWFSKFFNYFQGNEALVSIFNTILFVFALFFLTVISYCVVRLFEIRKKEKEHLHHEIAEYAHHQREREKKKQEKDAVSKNPRWIKTLGYLFSQHPGDWKLAIIEADSMLESLLDQLGFKGENLGDKLKGATQEKFSNLTKAWEVHTIRNKIAHEGASFEISQHEAKRVIALYEQIFREFGYI
jgi:hypothetical protein